MKEVAILLLQPGMAATQVELDFKAAPQWVTTKKGTLDVHLSSLANKFQLRK